MSWLTLSRTDGSHGGVTVPVWSRRCLVVASQDIWLWAGNHRYFASESVKDDHYRSKRHKKRVKVMSGPAPHTQLDAELAAGMGKPDNGLKLMSM
ncbi:Zinc finger protein 593 [Zea mays]|uniref:Zinc finger protein 593 n=1 Tax=Zea mays TaxID=4577 RepID=A0A1D6KLY7_MAIZE|nr:Zinc finger protein 593 [Zea mays]